MRVPVAAPQYGAKPACFWPLFGRILIVASCFRTYLPVADISDGRVIPRILSLDVAEHNAQNVFESLQGHLETSECRSAQNSAERHKLHNPFQTFHPRHPTPAHASPPRATGRWNASSSLWSLT